MAELTIHTYTAAESGLFVNSYLLETPDGVMVVDTNLLVSDIVALNARLAALHKPLLGVFVTHAHPDHFNGALELVRRHEVPVHATMPTPALSAEGGPSVSSTIPDGSRIQAGKPARVRLPERSRLTLPLDGPLRCAGRRGR